MKKLLSLLAALALVVTLAACGGSETEKPEGRTETVVEEYVPEGDDNPYANDGVIDMNDLTAKDPLQSSEDYRTTYGAHYDTLNYLYSQSAGDNEYTANMIDGLVEVNRFNQIVPSLATDWSFETVDGKQVWTFHIRENVYWQDNETLEPVAMVTAQDWVTSARYILEPIYNSELISLMTTFIDGGSNYNCSRQAQMAEELGQPAPPCTEEEDYEFNIDFDQVGVKALDLHTLQYTLTEPAPYFITVLTYNAYYPANIDYILEQGDDFGKDSTKLLINGAYHMTSDQQDIEIELTRNPYYWDAEHVYAEKIRFQFAGGDLGTDFYRKLYEAGEIDGFRLVEDDTSGMEYYIYGEDGNGTLEDPARAEAVVRGSVSPYTYHNAWNFDRASFVNSVKTEDQQEATKVAILNADFRLGFMFGYDRTLYTGVWTPDDPTQWLRNTYSPRELATDSAGRDYVEYVYDVIAEKEGIPREDVNAMYEDGNDALYQPERAAEHFAAAKEALLAEGLTEADFPIQIELVASYNATRLPYSEAVADKFNAEWGEFAEIVYFVPGNYDEWYAQKLTHHSYDMYDIMGWGPDYQDPRTYLNTYAIGGDMIGYAGLGADNYEVQVEVLGAFDEMYREAAGIVDDLDARMRAFAESEYYFLFEEGIIYPYISPRGDDIFISNVQPFTMNSVNYGLGKYKYKGIIVLDRPITADEREQLLAEMEAERDAQ